MDVAIIFDIGSTLLETSENKWEDFNNIPDFPNDLHEFEKHNITTNEFIKKYCNILQTDEKDLLKKFNKIITGNWLSGMDILFKECSDKYPVYLLSNINPIHWSICSNLIPKLYKHAFLSYEIGSRKPEVGIYSYVNRTLLPEGIEQFIFFDDKSENIQTAKKMGWNAYIFNSADECRKLIP